MDANRVLVVGGSKVGKTFVSKALPQSAFKNGSPYREVDLKLHTKYYSADVQMKLINTETTKIDKMSKAELKELGNGCQGLIFVYDSKRESTFKALKEWTSFVEETESAHVRLLVSNSVSQEEDKKEEKLREQALDWAIDYNFELVDISYNDVKKECLDTREKLGSSRVFEALCCSLWQNRASPVEKKPSEVVKEKVKESKELEDDSKKYKVGDSVEIFGLKSKPHYNGKSGLVQGYIEKKNRFSIRINIDNKPVLLNIKAQNLKAKEMKKEVAVEEIDSKFDGGSIEDLEKLMAEMRRTRDTAGNVSDAERRKRAEDMILKFASMMEDSP